MPFDPIPLTKEERAALRRAGRYFLKHPEGHCKHHFAQDRDGDACSLLSEDATQWCCIGRVCKELGEESVGAAGRTKTVLDHVGRVIGDWWGGTRDDIPSWNNADERTPAEVGAKLMEAAVAAAPGSKTELAW